MIFKNLKVSPSYIGSRAMGLAEDTHANAGVVQLLMGEVKEIVEPSSPKSLSKQYKEYHVAVQLSDGRGPVTTVSFPNCLAASMFGSAADKLVYTLRPDPKTPTNKEVATTGSKVLLLCLNGNSSQAFIIGALRDDKEADEEGHNLAFEFNGIGFTINDEGELELKFRGATKTDGELDGSRGASDDNGPTVLKIEKDGSFEVQTKDKAQLLRLDHSDGKIYLKSDGVQTGAATDAQLLGTTYRTAEKALHQALVTALTALSAQVTAAGTAFTNAASPNVSTWSAAKPYMAAAGAALTSAVAAITGMMTAIQSFEAAGPYLSKKNNHD